ncbi:MAG: hypothetical protein RL095_3501 [Verrucomicrobiota bacterium]|jgi:LacI family transcriptional regulator
MPRERHILLLIEATRAYGRSICHGIAEYARLREDWILMPHERPVSHELPQWIRKGEIDGVIAYIPSREISRKLQALKVPVVDVQGKGYSSSIPVFDTDPDAVGRLAVNFLRNAGFKNLAFCGYPGIFFSDRREAAVARLVGEDDLAVYHPPHEIALPDWRQQERGAMEYESDLCHWLQSLPKPVAILACNDIRGQQIINACRSAGIAAPGEVAVLGIDDDDMICELCRPTLSSIAPNTYAIGWQAASTLADMLDGKAVFSGLRNIPPLRIVERQSTDIVPSLHPVIIQATRMIRNRACQGLSVEQICAQLKCSRSTLDALFARHLGRSVSSEILRVRLTRAKQLLLEGQRPLAEIARDCGFLSSAYFCRFFKRETGQTPAAFRDASPR